MKQSTFSTTWILIIKKNILKKHIIQAVFFCVCWKLIFESQHIWSFVSFVFIFMLSWINSNKFELIHLNMNMKTKENCFKNFNNIKVLIKENIKTTTNFYKINTKTLKILATLLILFFSVFSLLGYLCWAHLFFYLISKHWNK